MLFILTSHRCAARVWELQTGQCTKTFQGHSNAVYGIAHSWQQNLLASGHEDQTIKLWDVNLNASQRLKVDLQPFRVLYGHSNRIFSVAFSPNGQFLASASCSELQTSGDETANKPILKPQ